MARGPLSAMPDPGDVDPNDTDGAEGEDPKEEAEESPGEAAAEDLSSAIAGGDAKEIWAAFRHCYEECQMDAEGGEEPGKGPAPGGLLAILGKKKA